MNLQASLGKIRRNATPHAILSAVIIVFLLYVVIVPLVVMVKETFIVHLLQAAPQHVDRVDRHVNPCYADWGTPGMVCRQN